MWKLEKLYKLLQYFETRLMLFENNTKKLRNWKGTIFLQWEIGIVTVANFAIPESYEKWWTAQNSISLLTQEEINIKLTNMSFLIKIRITVAFSNSTKESNNKRLTK